MYKIIFVGLIGIAAAISNSQQIPKNMVKMIKVYRFAPCNTSSSMILFNTSTLTVTGGIKELNIVGFVNITTDIPSPISMLLTTQKCDQQGLNCENYISVGYPDCCHVLNIPFFSFLNGFEPEIRSCPLRKTILKTRGIRYDMSAWMHLAMYNKQMAKYNFYDLNLNNIICFEMDWAILPKRMPRKTKNVTRKNVQ